MSELRRRILGHLNVVGESSPESSPSISREVSPAPDQRSTGEYKVVPTQKLEKLKNIKRKGTKRRNAWIFALGSIFGILVAGYFASNNGSLDSVLDMAGIRDMRLDTLFDVLPAGLIKDVQDIQVSYTHAAAHSRQDFNRLMLTKGYLMAGRGETSRRLRFIQDRPCCAIARRGGQVSCNHDTWCYIDRARELGDRRAV